MIEQPAGLNHAALEAIADLERRSAAFDGGRLKLEWSTLRSRAAGEVQDLLWREDGRLVGFLGIYCYRAGWAEVTGMVDPDYRRQGIGRALPQAALPLVRARAFEHVLLIVPRSSPGGHALAVVLGRRHDHSEHTLRLHTRPADGPADPAIGLRQSTAADIPVLSALYLEAFGDVQVDPDRLDGERPRTLMITWNGDTAGAIAVARDGARGAIYGFALAPSRRGRGIGRQVLRRVCTELFDAGTDHVDLDVEVTNDRPLGLYESVGFVPLATDDYYELLLD